MSLEFDVVSISPSCSSDQAMTWMFKPGLDFNPDLTCGVWVRTRIMTDSEMEWGELEMWEGEYVAGSMLLWLWSRASILCCMSPLSSISRTIWAGGFLTPFRGCSAHVTTSICSQATPDSMLQIWQVVRKTSRSILLTMLQSQASFLLPLILLFSYCLIHLSGCTFELDYQASTGNQTNTVDKPLTLLAQLPALPKNWSCWTFLAIEQFARCDS